MRQLFDDSQTSSGNITERAHRELRDLSELMAGSLNVKDVFRSVSTRVSEITNCSGTKLWLLDETRTHLRPAACWDMEQGSLSEDDLRSIEELAKRCFDSKTIVVDTSPAGATRQVAALFLVRGGEVIGVMQLFFSREDALSDKAIPKLKEIGTLVSPVIVASMIFERGRARSLTDSVTQLPNERAFHSVLEDLIADSRGPFSVLALDIKNFQGINNSIGHSYGDEVLRQVGRIARENLREMDFFARSHNDEFLAVLPTASENVSREIIARIELAVDRYKLQADGDMVSGIGLNIGWAVFGRDGDTAAALLARARLRKAMSKDLPEGRKVLLFPQAAIS